MAGESHGGAGQSALGNHSKSTSSWNEHRDFTDLENKRTATSGDAEGAGQ